MDWHKRVAPPQETANQDIDHLARSQLSFAAGRNMYLTGNESEICAIGQLLDDHAITMDRIIEQPIADHVRDAVAAMDALLAKVRQVSHLTSGTSDDEVFCQLVGSLCRLFRAAEAGDFATLVQLANSDEIFVRHWGMSVHFAVLKKGH